MAPAASKEASASGQQPPAGAESSGSGAAPASPPAAADAAPKENPWEVNKPVERRTQALNEEMHDCLYCFWSWITCGGPGARVRQLYVNGKLSRCMDDWTKLRNCMIFKMDPEKDMALIPGPHPVWKIRTRKQAQEFWQDNYRHLREGAPRQGGALAGVGAGADPDRGTLATPCEPWRGGGCRGGCGRTCIRGAACSSSAAGVSGGNPAGGGSSGACQAERLAAGHGREQAAAFVTRQWQQLRAGSAAPRS